MNKNLQTKSGRVISNKMKNCLVIEIESISFHPLYKKQIKKNKKYHVHCEDNQAYQLNQVVNIVQCRPISKTIRWKVVK